MTTPDTPIPAVPECACPHGFRRRYRKKKCHAPCRCTPCKAAQRRYDAGRTESIKAGKPYSYPVDQIADHLAMLKEHGISRWRVSRLTGVSEQVLRFIAYRKSGRVFSTTGEAVLSITPEVGGSYVNATGTHRRILALLTLGYSYAEQAALLGVDKAVIRMRVARARVTPAVAQQHRDLYDELYASDSTNPRAAWTRSTAARIGHLPPEAWTDATIDDPRARPWGHLKTLTSRNDVDPAKVWQICEQTRRYSAEETTIAERDAVVTQLHARGLSDGAIAEITGWPERTVLRIRARLNLPANEQFFGLGPAYRTREDTAAAHIARLQRHYRAIYFSAHTHQLAKADARTALADLADAAAQLDTLEIAA